MWKSLLLHLCLNAKTLRITLIIQKFILCEKLNYDFRPKCRFLHFSMYIITCKGNKGEGVDIQVKSYKEWTINLFYN